MPIHEEPLGEVRSWSGDHVFESTARYFFGELTPAEYRAWRQSVGTNALVVGEDRKCLLHCLGGQPPYLYDLLAEHHDIALLWKGPLLPLPLYPLSIVVTCHAGLLLVESPRAARIALQLLSNPAMVQILSFSADIVDDVASHVRRKRWRSRPGSVVGRDPTYFLLGVERGNPHAAAGIFGWCSYGHACPRELQDLPSVGGEG